MSRRTAESSRTVTGPQILQPFSGLPPTTVPLDQLQQIQKRLQALVLSTGQLQMEVAMAPSLDWPTILSRFGTLVSQTYSLSSSLTSSSSAFLPAQLDEVQRTLEDEAKRDNYFLQEDDVEQPGGFAEAGDPAGAAASSSVPRVRYTDPRNPLPRLAAVPILPLEASTDKVGRLGEALRTKLDPELMQLHSDLVGGLDYGQSQGKGDDGEKLSKILQALQEHDQFTRRALRAWYHVRWRPDEDGQTYDFKMRLGDEDAGEVEEDLGPDADEVEEERAGSVQTHLTSSDVEIGVGLKSERAGTQGGHEAQQESDGEDDDDVGDDDVDDDDEEMEDIDVS